MKSPDRITNSSFSVASPGAFKRMLRAASPNVRAVEHSKLPTIQTCAFGLPSLTLGRTLAWTPSSA